MSTYKLLSKNFYSVLQFLFGKMLREIEKLTSQLNDIEMEVEEECDNDGNASPRHHFRPTRSELEEKVRLSISEVEGSRHLVQHPSVTAESTASCYVNFSCTSSQHRELSLAL